MFTPALHSLMLINSVALRLQRGCIGPEGVVGNGRGVGEEVEGDSVGKVGGGDVEEEVVEVEGYNNKTKKIQYENAMVNSHLRIIICDSSLICNNLN